MFQCNVKLIPFLGNRETLFKSFAFVLFISLPSVGCSKPSPESYPLLEEPFSAVPLQALPDSQSDLLPPPIKLDRAGCSPTDPANKHKSAPLLAFDPLPTPPHPEPVASDGREIWIQLVTFYRSELGNAITFGENLKSILNEKILNEGDRHRVNELTSNIQIYDSIFIEISHSITPANQLMRRANDLLQTNHLSRTRETSEENTLNQLVNEMIEMKEKLESIVNTSQEILNNFEDSSNRDSQLRGIPMNETPLPSFSVVHSEPAVATADPNFASVSPKRINFQDRNRKIVIRFRGEHLEQISHIQFHLLNEAILCEDLRVLGSTELSCKAPVPSMRQGRYRIQARNSTETLFNIGHDLLIIKEIPVLTSVSPKNIHEYNKVLHLQGRYLEGVTAVQLFSSSHNLEVTCEDLTIRSPTDLFCTLPVASMLPGHYQVLLPDEASFNPSRSLFHTPRNRLAGRQITVIKFDIASIRIDLLSAVREQIPIRQAERNQGLPTTGLNRNAWTDNESIMENGPRFSTIQSINRLEVRYPHALLQKDFVFEHIFDALRDFDVESVRTRQREYLAQNEYAQLIQRMNSLKVKALRFLERNRGPIEMAHLVSFSVTNREALALAWFAINDRTVFTTNEERAHATWSFFESFAAIQTAHNDDPLPVGSVSSGSDRPSCEYGTTVRLLGHLGGKHPDVPISILGTSAIPREQVVNQIRIENRALFALEPIANRQQIQRGLASSSDHLARAAYQQYVERLRNTMRRVAPLIPPSVLMEQTNDFVMEALLDDAEERVGAMPPVIPPEEGRHSVDPAEARENRNRVESPYFNLFRLFF